MEYTKFINCGNAFYQSSFNELCMELENNEVVEVYIDCIGHTRNNIEQEGYKRALEEKYGDKLEIQLNSGGYSYSYTYRLKPDK